MCINTSSKLSIDLSRTRPHSIWNLCFGISALRTVVARSGCLVLLCSTSSTISVFLLLTLPRYPEQRFYSHFLRTNFVLNSRIPRWLLCLTWQYSSSPVPAQPSEDLLKGTHRNEQMMNEWSFHLPWTFRFDHLNIVAT